MHDQSHDFWLEEWVFAFSCVHGKDSASFSANAKLYVHNESKLTIKHDGQDYDLATLPVHVSFRVGVTPDPEDPNLMVFYPAYKSRDGLDDTNAFVQIYLRTDKAIDFHSIQTQNRLRLFIKGVNHVKHMIEGSEATVSESRIDVEGYHLYRDEPFVDETTTTDAKIESLKKRITYLGYGLIAIGALVFSSRLH